MCIEMKKIEKRNIPCLIAEKKKTFRGMRKNLFSFVHREFYHESGYNASFHCATIYSSKINNNG